MTLKKGLRKVREHFEKTIMYFHLAIYYSTHKKSSLVNNGLFVIKLYTSGTEKNSAVIL